LHEFNVPRSLAQIRVVACTIQLTRRQLYAIRAHEAHFDRTLLPDMPDCLTVNCSAALSDNSRSIAGIVGNVDEMVNGGMHRRLGYRKVGRATRCRVQQCCQSLTALGRTLSDGFA